MIDLGGVRLAQQFIHRYCHHSAYDGTSPVDPVVFPHVSRQSGSEATSWVERRASYRAPACRGDSYVAADGDRSECTLRAVIGCHRQNDESQEERQDDFGRECRTGSIDDWPCGRGVYVIAKNRENGQPGEAGRRLDKVLGLPSETCHRSRAGPERRRLDAVYGNPGASVVWIRKPGNCGPVCRLYPGVCRTRSSKPLKLPPCPNTRSAGRLGVWGSNGLSYSSTRLLAWSAM